MTALVRCEQFGNHAIRSAKFPPQTFRAVGGARGHAVRGHDRVHPDDQVNPRRAGSMPVPYRREWRAPDFRRSSARRSILRSSRAAAKRVIVLTGCKVREQDAPRDQIVCMPLSIA
jgi:hypothetical protein